MAIPVGLGMPAAPPPVLAPRRKTRQLDVGGVGVGSDFPVSVQSMCTTKTADINATLQQIAELTASGCQIVRVAVPDTDDAEALPIIARKSQIPVIADIHFQPRYVFAAIDAGSLDKRLLAKYGKATPEALVESALWECSLFEEHDFRDIKISVKHNDPVVMVRAAGGGGQGRQPDPRVLEPPPARAGDRQLPFVRARAGRRLQAGRRGHRRAGGHGGAAPRRRHGLRRER